MRIGEVFRYPRLSDAKRELDSTGQLSPSIDGLPSFMHATRSSDGTLTGLERGISPLRRVSQLDGPRTPAILIRSSPHKIGSTTTPWQDFFDPDAGYVRYFGDAKAGQSQSAEDVPGNRRLLSELVHHQGSTPEERQKAAPLLLFRGVPYQGRLKGQVVFQGLAVIESAELVAQFDPRTRRSFPNYRFNLCVLDISAEGEDFDWAWINARRDPEQSLDETLALAPTSWRRWVAEGREALPALRRRVARLRTASRAEQLPDAGSRAERILHDIVKHYEDRQHSFEALAELVTERLLRDSGTSYRFGWITPRSGDAGVDFVGRIDLGSGFARAKIIVLGQAKCVAPTSATGGLHLARLVARLRRGWLGVFVTTGHYSLAAQREVIEDRYPLMLVNGRQLAETVWMMMHEAGVIETSVFLNQVDSGYDGRLASRDPETLLLDA